MEYASFPTKKKGCGENSPQPIFLRISVSGTA